MLGQDWRNGSGMISRPAGRFFWDKRERPRQWHLIGHSCHHWQSADVQVVATSRACCQLSSCCWWQFCHTLMAQLLMTNTKAQLNNHDMPWLPPLQQLQYY